ncbi:MAG: D-alanyl-D-alanine carboxypeptidase [Lachnospiraceae bacterium]|nr:D-alanyl-D-alanine carboxypeptidase [Lachnospiraceae bacterium]MBO5145119.1 D-alanyl-D-alanine carboxypeptidase [Lachnospiraceae bacterium]
MNKLGRTLWTSLLAVVLTVNLTGCGAKEYTFAYDRNRNNSSFSVASHTQGYTLEPFASDLCVATGDISKGTDIDMSQATAAGLFDITSRNVIYAKNVHEKLNPASLTKILTALCALKYSNPDDVLTASENVYISESGAVKLGIQAGDTMTMDQALYALLLKSANDVAIMIAEHVGGSVEGFADMMNEMANSLGATNSHFVNPNGLTDPNHYTTAYDLYLICNEAVKYDKFIEIIHTPSYTSVYHDQNGNEKSIDLSNTNAYIKGEAFAPDNVTVIGGKTGTTSAAGNCLLLYSRDNSGNPYISIILQSSDRTTMYQEMTALLGEI